MRLQLIIASPVIMAVISLIVFIASKLNKTEPRDGKKLFSYTVKYALVGAGVTLIFTIASMICYERTTGYSAGNGPLGWIFIYGPLGVAFGQLVALIQWRFKKAI